MGETCYGGAEKQNARNKKHAQEKSFLVPGSTTDLNKKDSDPIDAMVQNGTNKQDLQNHRHRTLYESHDAVETLAALAQVVDDPDMRTKVERNGQTGYSVEQPGHVAGMPSVREVFAERHQSTSFSG
jgi:hypothetical protein